MTRILEDIELEIENAAAVYLGHKEWHGLQSHIGERSLHGAIYPAGEYKGVPLLHVDAPSLFHVARKPE